MAHTLGLERLERRPFVRHFFEMVAAMVGGMIVLGGFVKLFCALTGHEGLLDHPGASAPIMATNMTAGMSLWMWHRGHGWAAIGEMAAAMYVPLAVLLVPLWVGVLPGGALLGAMHVLMLPAMWVAMLHRRDEYAHHNHKVAAAGPYAHSH
jgi:flagellar biosynthetic protein FliP